jgi:CRP/FNR family transcriptional regulator, cyclic AMP receptor protein
MESHWHLSEGDFFLGLEREKEAFLALATRLTVKRNAFVFLESEPGDCAYYLERGNVLIFRSSAEGKEPIMSVRLPGELFGLAEVLGGRERKCNARAISEAVVHRIAGADFAALLAGHHALALRVIAVLGRRLRYMNEVLENLMVLDAPTRLLKALLYLCFPQMTEEGDWERPVSVPMRLTQEQIAAMTGSCQQTVSETLKDLQREGLIEVSGREIKVMRPLEVMRRIYI